LQGNVRHACTDPNLITLVCEHLAVDELTPIQPAVQQARLRTDVFLTFGGKGATLLLGLATAVVIARELGPSGQGTFAVAYSLTILLVHVGGLGLTTANPYFAAQDRSLRPRLVANSLWLAGLLGLLLVGFGFALKLAVPGAVEGLSWTALAVTLAGVPASLLGLFLQSILLGEGRIVAYNAVEVGQAIGALVALVGGYALFDLELVGTLAVLTVARYVGAVVYLGLLASEAAWRADRALARRTLKYGLRVYAAIVLSYLLVRFDVLLVNSYLGSQEAGLYSVAAALADGLFVLPMVVALNLLPRVARGDPTQASAEVFRSVAVLYGLLCLLTIPVASPAIRLLFGEEFAGATSLYYWLLPGIFSYGMVTILSSHFAGRGYPVRVVVFWIIGFALNLVLNVVFLPGRGAYIASLSSSIAYTLLLFLHMALFAREAGGYDSMRPRIREVGRFVRVALSRTPP
jgi:O-antigen/teichoic acid export membrane protein